MPDVPDAVSGRDTCAAGYGFIQKRQEFMKNLSDCNRKILFELAKCGGRIHNPVSAAAPNSF
jgi:hypothetical protein